MPEITRSEFLKLSGTGLAGALIPGISVANVQQNGGTITEDQIKVALKLANLSFEDDEVKEMLDSVKGFHDWWPELRDRSAEASFMGMNWHVVSQGSPSGPAPGVKSGITLQTKPVERPKLNEDLAFMSVAELGWLIRNGKVTSVELTQLFINRLKKYGPKLRCVVTITEERALKQAAAMDQLSLTKKFNGPLHGIPFGVKDLFEAEGYPTTWGIRTRKNAISIADSDVVKILEDAGGVLVAKLSLGALAMGDVWYEGRTESPWNKSVGSSGSSAGSASAVAAGLVPYAIGTETNGSLVSPAHNCRVTTLRPTFGSVSREGAMALCWSLDKVGPICRTSEDCAIVFNILKKFTGNDPSFINRFVHFEPKTLKDYKWGYMVFNEGDVNKPISDENRPWIKVLNESGIEPVPVYMPPFPEGLNAILYAECAAAFESFTRSNEIQDLEGYSSWPETFRSGRLIPAVEYIQADRYRRILAQQYGDAISQFDVVLADDRLYPRIYGLNVTGIPQMLVPAGVDERGRARSFSLVGKILDEGKMLEAAHLLQQKLGFHTLRPDMSIWD